MPSPYKLVTSGSSVVVLGDFNPAIFSPDWLYRNQLIGDQDLEFARAKDTLLVSRRVSICDTDWFHLQAIEKQLWIESLGVLTPAVRDLAQGILLLLSHTPITALGMNFHGHYEVVGKADWNKIGDTLAPKNAWHDLFDKTEYAIGLANLQVTVQRGSRDALEHPADLVNIQVQPSMKVKQGVYLMLNDHRTSFAQVDDKKTTAEHAADLVTHEWELTWKMATSKFDELLSKVINA